MSLIRKSFPLFLLSLFILPALHAQRTAITGKVTDNNGKPIPYVLVELKNTKTGVSTDSLGGFRINASPTDSLVISIVGFFDTTVLAGSHNPLDIVLQSKPASLHEAVVTGEAPAADNHMQATTEQIITAAFQDYVRAADFSNGNYHSSYLTGSGIHTKMVNVNVTGFGALNTINSGAMLPVLKHQDETKGSRYLLKNFAYGVIVDNTGKVIADSVHLLNYDKIDGQLMIAQGDGNYLEVDKEKVAAFAFKTPDTSFVFLNVPILSKINYFMLIASGPRYSVYKSVRTKFTKANYVSNGLTESGNNYDEYVDTDTYFWVAGKDSAGVFELKKKSIKSVFANEKTHVDDYFTKHKLDDIDDHFIKGLIDDLNNAR